MSVQQQLKSYVSSRLQWLQSLPEHPQRAALANLRHGLGRAPGELPQLWGTFLQEMPEEMQSRTGDPTREEWAAYLALTLYALHQQGHTLPAQNMNSAGQGLGRAARRLVPPGEPVADSSIQKRFNALATATQMPELAQHLRGMVQLLRAKDIPLDYAQLAVDLYDLQHPDKAARVRLRWGQDFYKEEKPAEEKNQPTEQ